MKQIFTSPCVTFSHAFETSKWCWSLFLKQGFDTCLSNRPFHCFGVSAVDIPGVNYFTLFSLPASPHHQQCQALIHIFSCFSHNGPQPDHVSVTTSPPPSTINLTIPDFQCLSSQFFFLSQNNPNLYNSMTNALNTIHSPRFPINFWAIFSFMHRVFSLQWELLVQAERKGGDFGCTVYRVQYELNVNWSSICANNTI